MPDTAVLERGAAPPETGTDTAPTGAVDSNVEGTEREQAQTGQEPNEQEEAVIGTESTDEEEVDPEEAAIQAKAEARAQELLEQREAEREAQAKADAEEREAAARAERHAKLFPETVQSIEAAIKAQPLYDDMGNRVEWTPAMLDAITAPFKAAHLTIWEDTKAALYTPIQAAVKSLIPESDYDAFKKEASGKPPEDYFRAAVERIAPTTKWAKSLSLDDAEKLSPKVKAEIKARITEEIRKDRAKGRKAGEPASDNSSTTGRSSFASIYEASAAFNNGEITREQYGQERERFRSRS